jgi:hypothetical protein
MWSPSPEASVLSSLCFCFLAQSTFTFCRHSTFTYVVILSAAKNHCILQLQLQLLLLLQLSLPLLFVIPEGDLLLPLLFFAPAAKLKEKPLHVNHLKDYSLHSSAKSDVKPKNYLNNRKQYRSPLRRSYLQPAIIEPEIKNPRPKTGDFLINP